MSFIGLLNFESDGPEVYNIRKPHGLLIGIVCLTRNNEWKTTLYPASAGLTQYEIGQLHEVLKKLNAQTKKETETTSEKS